MSAKSFAYRRKRNRKSKKMETVTLEIRAAEGGEDSKLFVVDLASAYQRYFSKIG
jgi:protein subunit release factor A